MADIDRAVDEYNAFARKAAPLRERIEELEIVVRAALSFVQERHTDHNDGHAQMVIAALRGALRNRERD